ncbi:MAG TPA: hypothetical protein VN317_00720, partial [Candidatus Methanoperedens sp.]|nr:hypothetical protein [Candidatus Methanoperedens sp.]
MFRSMTFCPLLIVALIGILGSTAAEAADIASGETRAGVLVGGTGGNNREETWTFTGTAGDRVVIDTA